MATIWLLLSAYLPTVSGNCRMSQCRDLDHFVNCTVDDATSGVAKTVVLGHCSDFFAMKFVIMSQLWSPTEPLLYSFSLLRDRLSSHSADRPSWWALQQLKRVQSDDTVMVQSPRARETERRLAAQAAKAPLAFGIQMPRLDCTICVDLVQPVWLFNAKAEAVTSFREALVNIQVDDRADGVVSHLLEKPDQLPCEGWLFFVLGYIHDIASIAVTTGLVHPDAHSGNLLYVQEKGTGDVRFSWCDFGASSLRYNNGTSDLPSTRWQRQIHRTLSSGVSAAGKVCRALMPAEWADLPGNVLRENQVPRAAMLAALATKFQVSLLRDSPRMTHVLNRVSRLSIPLLIKLESQQIKLESQQIKLESQQIKLESQQIKLESQQSRISSLESRISLLESLLQK